MNLINGKQLQWIWMMGAFHIEIAFTNCIGDWLERSDWSDVFVKVHISIYHMVVCGLFQNSLKELSVLAAVIMHSSYTTANVRFPCW